MNDEVLLESKALRTLAIEQVDPRAILSKVKALILLPDDVNSTTEQVAEYYEVSKKTIETFTARHRDELEADGFKVLRGAELEEFATFMMKVANSVIVPPKARAFALYRIRAQLRLGMLLQESRVAKAVRTALLDIVDLTKHEAPELVAKAIGATPKNGAEDLRAQHLAIQRMNAEARLKNALARQAKIMQELLDRHGEALSPPAKQTVLAYAVNLMAGTELIPLPTVEKHYTASEIAAETGVSPQMVGRIANRLGLKTGEYGVLVLDKSPYSDKQVESFRYNEKGRQKLIEAIREEKGQNK